ncbi:MAG: branched-chain amino acid ABC transporter permease [Alphaproteobacteria bacterium]|nr:MAG: branched-chain amino acid ABC transporter permease [Alphaproteobacteria bacterium]
MQAQHRPRFGENTPALLILLAIGLVIPAATTNEYYLHVLLLMLMGVILATSFRLMYLTGSLSIAHASFAAIGAYASALLVMRADLPFWLAMPIGGLAAAVVAIVLGYPALRTKGIYFAIVTLGIVEITNTIFKHFAVDLTGGAMGLLGVPRPEALWLPLVGAIDFSSKVHYYYLALIMVVVSVAALLWLERSRFGMIVEAIRGSEPLSFAVGINVPAYLLATFALTAFFAAITGAFMGHYLRIVSPHDYSFAFSTRIITYAAIGGLGAFAGPIYGAIFLTILVEVLREFGTYYDVMGLSIVLILVLLFLPGGLASLPDILRRKSTR